MKVDELAYLASAGADKGVLEKMARRQFAAYMISELGIALTGSELDTFIETGALPSDVHIGEPNIAAMLEEVIGMAAQKEPSTDGTKNDINNGAGKS